MTDTDTDFSAAAHQLRGAMVDKLLADGAFHDPRIAAAMRAVPRHLFTPGVDLETAYADEIVRYRFDERGACLSSVSAPWIQAAMIEAAGIEPGMRVLEIGSGGYNAALLSEIAGPTGTVTSVDIDAEVTARAIDCLEAAGYGRVNVVLADAAGGVPQFAPYHRILVTVAAPDVPDAWIEQLTPDGRIVLPLAVRGQQRIVAFDRDGDRLISRKVFTGGFVPMQGHGAHEPFTVALGPDGASLSLHEGEPHDAQALRGLLEHPLVQVTTAVTVRGMEPFDDLQLYLAAVLPATATLALGEHDATALPRPQAGFPALAAGGGTVAYISMLRHGQGEAARFEFTACALGPGAQDAADHLADLVRHWDATLRAQRAQPHVVLDPAGSPEGSAAAPAALVLRTPRRSILLTFPSDACVVD